MEAQGHHMHKRDASHATRTPPFERLPVEILREVLKLCLNDRQKITTIMQICRRLRHVALGMPAIWCNIRLVERDFGAGPQYGYDDVSSIHS
jgi:hypothetical protein